MCERLGFTIHSPYVGSFFPHPLDGEKDLDNSTLTHMGANRECWLQANERSRRVASRRGGIDRRGAPASCIESESQSRFVPAPLSAPTPRSVLLCTVALRSVQQQYTIVARSSVQCRARCGEQRGGTCRGLSVSGKAFDTSERSHRCNNAVACRPQKTCFRSV